jgi:hypothetical protein
MTAKTLFCAVLEWLERYFIVLHLLPSMKHKIPSQPDDCMARHNKAAMSTLILPLIVG